uniref:Integrator complex subunit 7 n=1 Tax=Latimeria chalumnae TaxID=7897 RepID=H3AI56_LATCH
MALSTSRPFLADVGCGEQELDANSALMELDKSGLRSGKLGEQCEAVVRFPRLFQRYPFPILINSAFLKLADVFRVGMISNNFLRLCVLKVTQQSEKHLEKILNVDEFVKRIFSVIHSNDPIARAITLRMLGSLASIIPERKNAHHSIRQSLDSHNNFEVEAAIFAAANFSAQSNFVLFCFCNYNLCKYVVGQDASWDVYLECNPPPLAASAGSLVWTLKNYTIKTCSAMVLLICLYKRWPHKITLVASFEKHHFSFFTQNASRLCFPSLKKLSKWHVKLQGKDTVSSVACFLPKGQVCSVGNIFFCFLQRFCCWNLQQIFLFPLSLREANQLSPSRVKFHVWNLHLLKVLVCNYEGGGMSKQSEFNSVFFFFFFPEPPKIKVSAVLKSTFFHFEIVYLLCEQLCTLGNHDIAVELYQSMLTQVASEHFYFWLNSLKEFSQAERCFAGLQDDDYSPALSCIEESLKSYHKGIASLTAASTPLNPLSFQCDFVKLRIDTLQAFSQLICTCNSLKTSPPPAIATAIALTSGNDLQRCGRISVQVQLSMKQSMEEFQSLATRYGELYQSSFDADSATLRNMELQQQSCLLISYAIEALILDPESVSFQESGFSGGAQAESEYERRMMSVFNRVFEETESLGRKYPPVSYLKHTACLCNAVIALLKVPFSFQRYFFQKLQSTSIKVIALSPSPRSPTEPIMVQNNQQMALKVEGVVQHGSKPGLFRRIQAVCLHVSSTLQNKTGQDYKIPLENLTNEMEQRVQPHNDYFSTQFLLNFAVLGNHSITVEASVADSNGIIWKTGPKTTIAAKSLEDPYSQQLRLQQQQQQQQPSSSSSQQQQQRTVYSRF